MVHNKLEFAVFIHTYTHSSYLSMLGISFVLCPVNLLLSAVVNYINIYFCTISFLNIFIFKYMYETFHVSTISYIFFKRDTKDVSLGSVLDESKKSPGNQNVQP